MYKRSGNMEDADVQEVWEHGGCGIQRLQLRLDGVALILPRNYTTPTVLFTNIKNVEDLEQGGFGHVRTSDRSLVYQRSGAPAAVQKNMKLFLVWT